MCRTEASLGLGRIVSDNIDVGRSLSVSRMGVGLRIAGPTRLLLARSAPRWVWLIVPSGSSMLKGM